jgi:hypothetical protein
MAALLLYNVENASSSARLLSFAIETMRLCLRFGVFLCRALNDLSCFFMYLIMFLLDPSTIAIIDG